MTTTAAATPETEFVTASPAAPLRPFIDRYVGYNLSGHSPGLHRGLPSRHLTFIVGIGQPIDVVAQTNVAHPPDRYRAVLSGLQATTATIAHDGNQHGVAIQLTPLGARALFGWPARELWDQSVELATAAGRGGDRLWERLQPGSWRDRFAACDDELKRMLCDEQSDRRLERAWRALVASGGQVPVASIADKIGWTRQHLAHRFKAEFGASPKVAARIIRFERAHHMLTATPSFVSLAQVAAACGYADQSHLHREVLALAGCTPMQLLDDLPNLHDDAVPLS